ncbi:cyclic AMP-dependent transcription factor ATF-1 [Mobula birostris]|uniref:cyclic AMP-dependent transcription factor ATF-1 n=1 Tax=Mobula birostris TaxID=1983395 RepID=UPI003B28058B
MEEVQRDGPSSVETGTSNPTTIQQQDIEPTQKEPVQSESEYFQEPLNEVSSSQKSHELLPSCSSYRKLLDDLSSEDATTTENDKGSKEAKATPLTTLPVPPPFYQTNTGPYVTLTPSGTIQLANMRDEGVHGLQALAVPNTSAAQPGTAILQYTQTTDGQQILVPSNQVVVQTPLGVVQAYQIPATTTTNSLPQSVMMTSTVTLQPQAIKTDDATLKREIRLMKNREAARECRRKKKEYVKCLENHVAVLENQNQILIEELKNLREFYGHKTT